MSGNNIIMMGQSDVGKTSILHQFMDNKFDENEPTTHGVTFRSVGYNYNGLKLTLAIWDPSSLPQYKDVRRLYYKDVSAAIIVYDVTNRLSFEQTNYWINTIREHSHLIKYITIVGNKIDLRDRFNPKHVTRKEVQEFSVRKNIEFFETSAKLKINIDELFSITFNGMVTRYVLTPIDLPVFKYKAILLGDSNVGKSSLVERFCGKPFPDNITNTLGIHFKSVNRRVKHLTIQLEFWDTSGQTDESTLMPMYYRDAQAVIIVYDIQCHQSFTNLRKYLNILYTYCEKMPYVVLLGNKTDLKSKREVQEMDVKEFTNDYDVIHLIEETSAKTDQNFDKLLNKISSHLLFTNIPVNQKLKIKQKQRIGKLKNWFKCATNKTS